MAAATNSSSKLNAAQRAAAVVIALGADNASEVYKYLRDEEVDFRRRCQLRQGYFGESLWPTAGHVPDGTCFQISAHKVF